MTEAAEKRAYNFEHIACIVGIVKKRVISKISEIIWIIIPIGMNSKPAKT